MCGIVCVIGNGKEIPERTIELMTASLNHRGPDASDTVKLNDCHLGHTRLSIIDLANGSQPMTEETRRYWIVFNGEIYNYRELRQQLERDGYYVRTNSDTEILLKACIAYGEKALSYLNGQFAFIFWDNQERILLAARDRMGEKPFYYAISPEGHLIIASEIKAIIASNLIVPQLDLISVDAYLDLLYVPPDRTIYNNIYPLRPAHALSWRDGKIKHRCYWQPHYSQNKLDEGEAIERINYLIAQAVKRQTVADVPVGAFLSGGLDSSTIVALMSQQSDQAVQTFSVGFGDLINELPYARAVAEKYHTEHHELQMNIPVAETLEKMALVYDEPFGDSSNIPTYLICKYAAERVKVVLSGDGGDELFGGYNWYPWLLSPEVNNYNLLLAKLRLFWLKAVCKLGIPWQQQKIKALGEHHILSRQVRCSNLYPDFYQRHLAYSTALKNERYSWMNEELSQKTDRAITTMYEPSEGINNMDEVIYFDINCYLPGDILVKVDRAAMANSLEVRAPFLDVDLVEFVLNLPWQLRFKKGNSKYCLRQACSYLWPDAIQNRLKQGFNSPINFWLERADVKSLIDRVIDSSSPLNHLLPKVSEEFNLLDFQDKWNILCLGLWLENNSSCLNNLQLQF